ncbi:hypothetical protein LIER_21393 [Lithospermum erythrorhizon]|uniref:Uncharacterized protein n=1 Tax=Lithospermum erythrorhizon TaxID=34254 RepID=A0AAV3QQ19_LITER
MSSSHVNLSSDHSDSQSYARDTPVNQELVDESQTATPAEIVFQEGITSAREVIQATKEGLSKKKKKKTLVKGENLPSSSDAAPGDKAASSEGKDKQGKDPTITKNSLPIGVEQSHLNHLREYFSIPSSVEIRLPSGADQVYHPLVARDVVANAGFELARKADCFGEENKDLRSQGPSWKTAELEEKLARVKKKLTKYLRINVLHNTEQKKLMEDYLGLHKKHEEVSSQRDKIQEESSDFDIQITQLSGYRDAVVVEASHVTQEVKRLEAEVKRLENAMSQNPKELWAAVENFKQYAEFEGALSAAAEHFKKSPEFLDALGANAAYWAYSFVRKYSFACKGQS